MRVLILTYLITCLSAVSGLSQSWNLPDDKTLYYKVKLTNIRFSIGDTVIPYSLLVEPTGQIDFEKGYDFSYNRINYARYRFEGKRKNTKTYKDTIISTKDKPFELISYFPPLNQDSTNYINGYDFDLGWSPHYEYEVRYSYILNGISSTKLYQSDQDSVIRIVVQDEKEVHSIFQIDLKETPLKIQYLKTTHNYDGEFAILEKGTSIVSKQKEIESLFIEFHKFNFSQESHFIEVDGSTQYLIEFKTDNSYFAYMRHYQNKDGRIPENAFPWTVRHLYRRNMKRK